MRNPQATAAANTAGAAAGGYGATASGIGANLVPFETRQMMNPTGMSQRDIGAQLTSGLAGAGGATPGLTGPAGKMGMTTRNPMGFSSALDQAAMQRDKAGAGVAEGVAAKNVGVKLDQQKQAESTLGSLYGMSSKAQGDLMGVQAKDIDTANQLSPAMQAFLAMGKDASSVAAGGGFPGQ